MTFFMLTRQKNDPFNIECSHHYFQDRAEFELYLWNERLHWTTYEFLEVPARCVKNVLGHYKLWHSYNRAKWTRPWPTDR
jgi:hypothetical protein